MSRIARIVTTSIATLEDTAPPFNLRQPDPAETLKLGLSLLDAAGAQGADLAVLPEGFTAAGLSSSRIPEIAEPLDGPAFRAVAERARRHAMYVVAGFYAVVDSEIRNVSVLIDRTGSLAGLYAKRHPTEGEIENGVVPGKEVGVFDTDFGRLGLTICFDLNWQDLWRKMAEAGAELVCWISAYEGGFPLQAYAWMHRYAIVASVWPYHARVIEKTGRIVAQSSRWARLAVHDLNLDKRLLHTDGQMHQIVPIQARYGSRVRIETLGEEHLWTVESLDPRLPIDEVIREFGLVEYEAFLARCSQAQARAVGSKVAEPGG
jgi:predicted amidohydrolase